jgi:hypothetical protein
MKNLFRRLLVRFFIKTLYLDLLLENLISQLEKKVLFFRILNFSEILNVDLLWI